MDLHIDKSNCYGLIALESDMATIVKLKKKVTPRSGGQHSTLLREISIDRELYTFIFTFQFAISQMSFSLLSERQYKKAKNDKSAYF